MTEIVQLQDQTRRVVQEPKLRYERAGMELLINVQQLIGNVLWIVEQLVHNYQFAK